MMPYPVWPFYCTQFSAEYKSEPAQLLCYVSDPVETKDISESLADEDECVHFE